MVYLNIIKFTKKIKSIISILLLFIFLNTPNNLHAQKHPYLFFTKNKMDVLKERIKTDTSISNNWNDIINQADGFLIKGNAKDNIDYLAIAWLITADKKYADKIKAVLIPLCSRDTWANGEMLQRS